MKSPQKSMSVSELQIAISPSIPGITKLEIKVAIKEMIKINASQKNWVSQCNTRLQRIKVAIV